MLAATSSRSDKALRGCSFGSINQLEAFFTLFSFFFENFGSLSISTSPETGTTGIDKVSSPT
jgi:hypothetical protein